LDGQWPAYRGRESDAGFCVNCRNQLADAKEKTSGTPPQGEVPMQEVGGLTRSMMKRCMGLGAKGSDRWSYLLNQTGDRMTSTIDRQAVYDDKRRVYDAYKRSSSARAGRSGTADDRGVRSRPEGNLYRIWNRMSSGSYFPRRSRCLHSQEEWGRKESGVSTVGDRVAQMVVKQVIEPDLDPIF